LNLKKERKHEPVKTRILILFLLLLSFSLGSLADVNFLKGTAYKTGIEKKEILVGATEIINSNEGIRRIAITDPDILDIRVLSKTSAMLRGKTLGRTSLLIWENKSIENRPTRFDIIVKRDVSNLLARLKLLDPSIRLEYVIIPTLSIGGANSSTTGPYALSYKAQITNVGDPPPSVVIKNPDQKFTNSKAGISAEERFILTGNVKNGEVIAKAVIMTATYIGESGNPKVVVRDGGMLAEELNSILSAGSKGGGNSGGGGSALDDDGGNFSSNLKANLENGSVVTSSSGKVISFLKVKTKSQIAVKVRFYEISKTRGKAFKSQFATNLPGKGTLGTGGALGSPVGGQSLKYQPPVDQTTGLPQRFPKIGYKAFDLTQEGAFPPGAIFGLLPKANLFFSLEAIETKGEGRVLAEPTIVVSNGEVGSFRAGGEVPIPSSTSSGLGVVAQEFEYKPYGISLNILPVITDGDTILMNLKAQTVDIDPNSTRGVTNAPAFRTRKIDTQVELDPTQALVLAGLIDQNSTRNLGKIPILGDIPILGALARSKEFSKGESELIIVLSPEIIRATNAGDLSAKINQRFRQKQDNEEYNIVPLRVPNLIDQKRLESPIQPGAFSQPTIHPVDSSKPSLINDLDQIYE